MLDGFVGEIRMVPFDRPMRGWLPCTGSNLPVARYQALFAVIGYTYGGGRQVFTLPDFQGRIPLGAGDGREVGQSGGQSHVWLEARHLPPHGHAVMAAGSSGASGAFGTLGNYAAAADAELAPTIEQAGGSQPHENRPPFQAFQYVICCEGVAPRRGEE